MKTIKQFLLAITVVSLFLITGCTTMQNVPYDDVYYSTTKGAAKDVATLQNSANVATTAPARYETGSLETVNTSGQNVSSVNPAAEGYTIDTLRTDTIKTSNADSVMYSKINTNLGFNSSSFGTGIASWSLGGYAGMFGYNTFAYDPFSYDFYFPYSYYPYYYNYPFGYGGWSLYSFSLGNPYWGFGFGYPLYGYYPYYGYGYGFGYPYYYGNTYMGRYYGNYGHRSSSLRGSTLPIMGGFPLAGTKSTTAGNIRPSGIRPSATTGKIENNTVIRPEGSIRYRKAPENVKSAPAEASGTRLQKPPVYRGNNGLVRPQYQRPEYRQQPANMAVPRYQKPKQYQSLDTRQPRSSNEYFRPQPQTIINGKATRVNTYRAPQRFNIYRPANTRSYNNYSRPVYRNSWIRSTRSAPVRNYSPSQQRFYSSPTFDNNNNTTNRSYTPPVRISTGGGNSGGGGGNRGGGGGGTIRR